MTSIDLLEIARSTGLRSHLHGLNSQDARAMLQAFLDALAAAQPVVEVGLNVPADCAHVIIYDDADMRPAMFAGAGARDSAVKTFERISRQWNAHLFVKIASNSRDDRQAGVNARLVPTADVAALAVPEAFHPDASHIHPDYRDGWNACRAAMLAGATS